MEDPKEIKTEEHTENAVATKEENLDKIPVKEQFSYFLSCGGEGLGVGMVDSFISYFLTNIAGIASSISGIMLMVSKIVDFFTDAIMGRLIDRTKNKNGKAKPWLLRCIIPYSLGLVLCFSAPFNNMTATIIWALIMYILCCSVGFTMKFVPQNSIVALSSSSPDERNKMQFAYVMGKMVFLIIASVCITPLTTALGGGKRGWLLTAVIIGLACAVLHVISYFGIHERVHEDTPRENENPIISIAQAWKIAFSNKYMCIMFIVMMLGSLNTMTQFVTYYSQYVLNDFTLTSVMMLVALVPCFIGAFIVRPIVPIIGKRAVNVLGMAVQLVGYIVAVIFSSNIPLLIVALVFANLGVSAFTATSLAMVADCIDFAEWKHNVRNTGTFYSAYNCVNKVATACKSGVVGLILAVGGYVSGNVATQPASAITAIKVGFLWVPIICAVLSLIAYAFYDLDKKLPQIRSDLEERRAAENADAEIEK